MAERLIQAVDAVDGQCACDLDREFTGAAAFVDPLDGHGWFGWGFALGELFRRLLAGPTHVVIVDQPQRNGRYVQLLVGHGSARIEVAGNEYLEGDDVLDDDAHRFLRAIDFRPPPDGGDDDADGAEHHNWWRVDSEPTAWELAQLVVDIARAGLEFVDDVPIHLRFFGAESPCVRCLPYVLGSTDDHCVLCDSPVVRVVFGFPGMELVKAAERGEVVLGGCVVGDGPSRSCPCGRVTSP